MSLDQLGAFMAAIKQVESGGNYRAVGPNTRYGRATGAYQFIDSTWGGYGGFQRAADAPPEVQDARARDLMTQYYNTYRSWDLVAVAWHAGPGNANKAQRDPSHMERISDVNMSTGNYVRRVMAGFGQAPSASVGTFGAGAATNVPTDPAGARAWAYQNYGYLASFLDHPEVGPILIDAAQRGLGEEEMRGLLANTNWWRQTSQAQRDFEYKFNTDPGSVTEEYNRKLANVTAAMSRYGLDPGAGGTSGQGVAGGLFSSAAASIALDSMRYAWDDVQLNRAIAAEVRRQVTPGTQTGSLATATTAVRNMARKYLITVSDSEALRWAQELIAGNQTEDSMTGFFQTRAMTRFADNPQITSLIQQGFTPEDLFAEHRSLLSQELDVPETQIDLLDPKYRDLLSFNDNGTIRPMTGSEAIRWSRRSGGKTDGWAKSTRAKGQVGELADEMARVFGTTWR